LRVNPAQKIIRTKRTAPEIGARKTEVIQTQVYWRFTHTHLHVFDFDAGFL